MNPRPVQYASCEHQIMQPYVVLRVGPKQSKNRILLRGREAAAAGKISRFQWLKRLWGVWAGRWAVSGTFVLRPSRPNPPVFPAMSHRSMVQRLCRNDGRAQRGRAPCHRHTLTVHIGRISRQLGGSQRRLVALRGFLAGEPTSASGQSGHSSRPSQAAVER